MELRSVRTEASPLGEGRVRLIGEVAYDDRPGQPEDFWFDVDGTVAPSLSSSGNPWLVCLVPLAARLGEPLRLPLPVDRLLYRNVQELTAVWRSWDPSLHRVEVLAETVDGCPAVRGPRTAAFFSGGVDSFFTLLRSTEPEAIRIDDLVTVRGFDISLKNTVALERRKARIASIADSLGKTAVDVATNLRSTRLKEVGWGRIWHACGLASVGLVLEGRYRRLVIASTHRYGDLVPLGSHPLTDPLLSTSRTEVLHDGATHDRFSKLEYIARHEIALANLHVCFRQASDVNCGACEKCLRTMVGLEVLGRLQQCGAFPNRRVGMREIARVFLPRAGVQIYWVRVRALARLRGRADLVRAIDRAMRRSARLRPMLAFVKWLGERRLVWRASGALKQRIMKDAIR